MHEGMPLRSKQANALPATVRAVTQSSCRGPDVPAFWAALGFKKQYSMIKAGHAFCCFLEGHEVDVAVVQVFKEAPTGKPRKLRMPCLSSCDRMPKITSCMSACVLDACVELMCMLLGCEPGVQAL